jgi:predicted histone-like DNA-binding protein
MSQKFIKTQNKNQYNPKSYGKYYATAVYDNHFIGTEELADLIQRQASVKKSDIKAVLQELGEAMKHFFELGQKIKLDGIGIMKVGFSSIGVAKKEDCTASTISTRRVLFQPETVRVVVGQEKKADGTIKLKYVNAITLLKDVTFEETHDNSMNVEPEENGSEQGSNSGSGSEQSGSGSQQEQQNTLAKPTISGVTPFTDSTEVTMSGPEDAEIYYTTDGSTPTAESTLYEGGFTLSDTTTVKAIAIKNGESSAVSTRLFSKGTGGEPGGNGDME